MHAFFLVIARFTVDVLFGIIGFGIIGTAVYFINKLIQWLESEDVPAIIIYILGVLEYALFFVDVAGFVFLVAMAFYRMVRQVWALRNER